MNPKTYPAQINRVVDGDTLEVELDLFPGIEYKITVRLLGVDTHETYGTKHESEEYQCGIKEKQFVEQWIENTDEVRVKVHGQGKYGRYLAEIMDGEDSVLNDQLIDRFDGVAY